MTIEKAPSDILLPEVVSSPVADVYLIRSLPHVKKPIAMMLSEMACAAAFFTPIALFSFHHTR